MTGWLPLLFVIAFIIRRNIFQYIFVVGMTALWIMIQHNWISMIDGIFLLDRPESELLLIHSALYVILSVISLPLSKYIFRPKNNENDIGFQVNFFDQNPQSYYIAFLPIVIGAGPFLMWADAELVNSWAERFSRLSLLGAFFFIYRHVLTGMKNFFKLQQNLYEKDLIMGQLKSLANHNQQIQENQNQLNELRNNLHEDYKELLQLLRNSDVQGAMKYLNRKKILLDSTKVIRFCRAPLINAAISIYFQQAKKFNIVFEYKIEIPPKFKTDESDFAILISNLLENAFNASQRQPANDREISIIIKHNGIRCVLEVANKYSEPLTLNKDGFPITNTEGHGIGVLSIRTFAHKYKAQISLAQSDDRVKFLMYWEE